MCIRDTAQWQPWAEEGMGDSDATAENAAELTPEEEALMEEMASMLEAVSYTHLDVYKRQEEGSSPLCVSAALTGRDSWRIRFRHRCRYGNCRGARP